MPNHQISPNHQLKANETPTKGWSDSGRNEATRGFTLIETLIGFLISSFFLLMVGFMFANIINVRRRILTITNLQKTADQILLNLTQEIRWADTVDVIASDHLNFTTDIQDITYQLDSDSLEKNTSNLSGNPFTTTESLASTTFTVSQFQINNRSTNLDRPLLDISLTLEATVNNHHLTYSNHTTISPRTKFPGQL